MICRNKYFAAVSALAVVLVALVAKTATAQDSNPGSAGSVTLGVWGGKNLEMQVTPQGATLEFDCAQGTISEPLSLDDAGKFHAKGTFHTEGGPVMRNRSGHGFDVVYSGSVKGDSMQLEFTLGDSNSSPEKFTLARGQSGRLRKCK